MEMGLLIVVNFWLTMICLQSMEQTRLLRSIREELGKRKEDRCDK